MRRSFFLELFYPATVAARNVEAFPTIPPSQSKRFFFPVILGFKIGLMRLRPRPPPSAVLRSIFFFFTVPNARRFPKRKQRPFFPAAKKDPWPKGPRFFNRTRKKKKYAKTRFKTCPLLGGVAN